MLFSNPTIAKQAKTLVVASDEWCPYICDDEVLPGFLVEIVQEIAKKNKIPLTFSLIPLARSLTLAKAGKVDIVLALTSQHIIDYQLQQSQLSFGGIYNDFYVKATKPWYFQDIYSLEKHLQKGAVLGAITGYEYGEKIDNLLHNNTDNIFFASGSSPLIKQLKMLQMGRLDIILDSRYTVNYQLSKMPEHNIIYAGTQGDFTPLFLGFSSLLDTELIATFDLGLKALQRSGQLTDILAKYSIQHWQAQVLKNSSPLEVIGE